MLLRALESLKCRRIYQSHSNDKYGPTKISEDIRNTGSNLLEMELATFQRLASLFYTRLDHPRGLFLSGLAPLDEQCSNSNIWSLEIKMKKCKRWSTFIRSYYRQTLVRCLSWEIFADMLSIGPYGVWQVRSRGVSRVRLVLYPRQLKLWYEDALSFSSRISLEVPRAREAHGEWTDKIAGQSQRVGVIYDIFRLP